MNLGETRGPERGPGLGAMRGPDLGATRDGPPMNLGAMRGPELGATRDGPAASFVGAGKRDLGATTASGLLGFAAQGGLAASELAATTDSLPRGSSAPMEVPERLGRYLVIQQLGAGGMGVVYKAYDPDLDRKVAVKLLRGHATEHTRARLLREAQAMAKLSHPGVVPVYDVGTVDGQVFVAMDFVAGETLQAWMNPPKPWQEVLDLFEQAGHGLAAAHAAGLIHRDFKPENVLLSREASGRLRAQVADFGLARRDDEAGPERVEAADLVLSRSSMLDHGLTYVGAVVGTPMYMSPEQHMGAPVDPRTDQFSFCVALFEALYGDRPFDGDTVEALAEAASSSKRLGPPAGSDVPGWLHRLCLRGLQPDREQRFPGMDELLDAMARGRGRGRNRWLFAGIAATVVAAVAGGVLMRGEAAAPQCLGGAERMVGVWDDEVRAEAAAAFTATGKVFAGDAWKRARAEVDRYSAAWLAMHRDSCEATMVRGEQSAELMDLRGACLAERLQDLRALTGLYAEADGTVVKQAVEAAQALPRLERCADAAALRESEATPPPGQAEAVAAVQVRLSEARALRYAGKAKDALARTTEVLAEAEALGFAPQVARARLNYGHALVTAGEHEAAVPALMAAAAAKLAVRDDEGLLDGMLALSLVLGFHLGRDKEATPWLALSEGVVKRLGDPPRALARVLLMRATVDVAAQRYEEAEGRLLRSTALVVEQLGADDPALSEHLNVLGSVYLRTGKYTEAQAQLERAVALEEAENGPNHPGVAFPLNNLALSFERQARYADAIATLRRAQALLERTSGADHPNVGLLRQNIAGMLRFAGDLPQARTEIDAAAKILEAKLGLEHPALGHAWTFSGDIAREQGELQRARADYQRADDMRRKVLGEAHPDRSLSMLGLGRVAFDEGKPAEAVVSLEKALALMSDHPDPIDQAEARFQLARALPADKRARARELANQARTAFAEAGVRAERYLAEVDEWLAAHP